MTSEDILSTNGEPLHDRDFVAALQRGEARAQEAFVIQTIGRMLMLAERILSNRADAEEVVQEAYISAFKGIAKFDGRSSVSTWLHRIVVNAALMRLRSKASRPEESIESLSPKFLGDGGHAEPPLAVPAPSPEREVMLRQDVGRALEALPADYRAVLVLRDVEGFGSAEIAETLGISHDSARQRLHRARQALMRSLGRDYQRRGA